MQKISAANNTGINFGLCFSNLIRMKMATILFEGFIDTVQKRKDWVTSLILILVVLVVGAGSLYMLLNTDG